MFDRLRKFVNDAPWLGWAVAGLILVISLFVYRYLSGATDPYSIDRLAEKVTIKCVETGEEWEMTRGEMELELRQRSGMVKEGEGIRNPKTGKYTGFPFSKSQWEETVTRINKERQAVIDRKAGKSSSPGKAPAGKEKK